MMDNENLTARVNIRVTPAEQQRLKAEAKAAGLTMSSMLRRHYLGLHMTSKVEHQMVNELRRVGGLLKHTLNTTGVPAPEIVAAINDIRSTIRLIAGDDR